MAMTTSNDDLDAAAGVSMIHFPSNDNSYLNRNEFPDGFVFGVGTAAYQVEGASTIGGKSPSVWDDFTSRPPGRIICGGENGNVACDMYHKFKEDIKMMKKLGFDAYRFSISWPRILPGGRISAGINKEGIAYYNEIIDTVIANGMKPYATIFHWDLPNILEKEYDGFLSRNIVKDFCEYAEICFWEFGDRVKWWTTVNEPWTYAVLGYVYGSYPPGRTRNSSSNSASDTKIDKIDPTKAPYTVGRNLLLCHAEAAHLYRQKFQPFQEGKIGIVLNTHWFEPLNPCSKEDEAATSRCIDFMLGWFLEPVLYGCYPRSMVNYVPDGNLEPFSDRDSELLRTSVDFVGINFYTSQYVYDDPTLEGAGYSADMKLKQTAERNKVPIGEHATGSSWLYITPWGIYKLMKFLDNKYPTIPPAYITENGVSENNDLGHLQWYFKSQNKMALTQSLKKACIDTTRCKYHQDHFHYLKKAINEVKKLDVRGYMVWAWCDTFEWNDAYKVGFGIMYVDFKNHQLRYPKDSALWFAKFLHNKNKRLLQSGSNKRAIEGDTENAADNAIEILPLSSNKRAIEGGETDNGDPNAGKRSRAP